MPMKFETLNLRIFSAFAVIVQQNPIVPRKWQCSAVP